MSTTGRTAQSNRGDRMHSRSQNSRVPAPAGSNTFSDSLTLQFDSRDVVVNPSDQSCSSATTHGAVMSSPGFPQAPGSGASPSSAPYTDSMQLQGPPLMSPMTAFQAGPLPEGMKNTSRGSAFPDTTAERKERRPRKEKADHGPQWNDASPPRFSPPPKQQQQQQYQQQMPPSSAYGTFMPGSAGYNTNANRNDNGVGSRAMPDGSGNATGAAYPHPTPAAANVGRGPPGGISENEYVMVRPEFLQMLLQQHQQSQGPPTASGGYDYASQQQQQQQQQMGYATNNGNNNNTAAAAANAGNNGYPIAAYSGESYAMGNGNGAVNDTVSFPFSFQQLQQQQNMRFSSPPPPPPPPMQDTRNTNSGTAGNAAFTAPGPRIEMLSIPGTYIIHSTNSKKGQSSASPNPNRADPSMPYACMFAPPAGTATSAMNPQSYPYGALPQPPPPQLPGSSTAPGFSANAYGGFPSPPVNVQSVGGPYAAVTSSPPPPPPLPTSERTMAVPLNLRGGCTGSGGGGHQQGKDGRGSNRRVDPTVTQQPPHQQQHGAEQPAVTGAGHRHNGAGNAPTTSGGAGGHAEAKNGANFVVGGWYEGVVKRYNPLRGFGFLTCTHQLRFNLRACERVCTRHADDGQTRPPLEPEAEKTTPTAAGAGNSLSDVDDQLRPLSTTCTDGKGTPAAQSQASLKESITQTPHYSAATNTFGDDAALHEAALEEAAQKLEEQDPSVAATDATSNGKTHGTAVYSTMQWYLRKIDAATAAAKSGSDGTAKAEEDTELDTLEREAAEMGDIFVHHSCISMDGFRVFVPGTVVRFSVAVLMDTVQAVDVVPLGTEWEKPLSAEDQRYPPLYKVTPTAATVLRYHNRNAEKDAEAEGDGPHSRVGSTSVQWTDMAVIPSAAIPNAVESESELQIVRVPQVGPIVPKITVTSTKSGVVTTGLAAGVERSPAAATAPSTPAVAATTTATAATAEAECKKTEADTAASTTDTAASEKTTTPLVELVDPDSIAVTFRAMDNDHQQALQGKAGAPALSPTEQSAVLKHGGDSHDEVTDAAAQREPTPDGVAVDPAVVAAVVAAAAAAAAGSSTLEKGSFPDFSGDPTAFSGGGLTSSKNDTNSGNDRVATATQTSGTGSRNITSTTTHPTQSSENTGSNRQTPQNGSDSGTKRDGAGDHGSRTPAGSSGDQEEPLSSRNMGGQQSSSGTGEKDNKRVTAHDGRQAATPANGEAGPENEARVAANDGDNNNNIKPHHAHGHHHHEQNEANAKKNRNAPATPQEPVDYGSPNLGTREGMDSFGGNLNGQGSSGGDSEDKDVATTTSTSRSANTLPDSNPGLSPDWTEVFDRKMANERAKDILMHKTDLKFFPHHSAKSAAAAAAVAAAAAAAASSTPRGGAGGVGAASGLASLPPEVVPLSAVGELDSSSSRGVEEDEDEVEEGSDSHSAARQNGHVDSDGYEANPSSSQQPTTADRSGETGTSQATPEESPTSGDNDKSNNNQAAAATAAAAASQKPKKSTGKAADWEKRRGKATATLPALAMVAVKDLPPSLAAQVPPGVTIIALPRETVLALKIRSSPVDPARVTVTSTPSGAEASVSILSFSNPQGTHSSPESVPWPVQPPAPQSPAASSDGEYFRNLVMAAGNLTTSSDSNNNNNNNPQDKPSQENESGPSRIILPFTTEPVVPVVVGAADAAAANTSAIRSQGVSPGKKINSRLSKISGGTSSAANTAHTSLSSNPVPVPHSMVDIPMPPWMRNTESALPPPPPQQPKQQRRQQQSTPSRNSAVGATPPHQQTYSAMPNNNPFFSLNQSNNVFQQDPSQRMSHTLAAPGRAMGYGPAPGTNMATPPMPSMAAVNGPAPAYPYPSAQPSSFTRATPGGNSGSTKSSSPWSSTRGQRSA